MEKGRLVAFDYGSKRLGIAVSDPYQLIASPLETIHPKDILSWLLHYSKTEKIAAFIVGEPRQMNNSPSEIYPQVEAFVNLLKKNYAQIPLFRIIERSTSRMAVKALVDSGARLAERRNKANIDMVSATLILQAYMEGIS